MPIARRHPCLGWLSCTPRDSQHLLDRQMRFRDEALANDPAYNSGMPPQFFHWTMTTWLPSVMDNPFYRQQVEQHIADLKAASEDIQDLIRKRVGSELEHQGEIDAEREQLIAVLEATQ